MNRFFLILLLSISSCAAFNIYDSLKVWRSGCFDSSIYVGKKPVSTAPYYMGVFDAGGKQLKVYPISSIGSLTPDSVRAAHKADHADSADVSGTSYGFIHGVPTGILLKAKSASSCTSSHVSENGDTVKITYTSAPGDTFTNSGLTPGVMKSGCSAPNGDCYFSVNYDVLAGDIFIQYAGTGVLNDLNQAHRYWFGMTSTSNGDIFACVYNGDLYKRTGGTGDFTSIGLSDYWYDITQFDDQLFAVDGDSIYQIDPVSLVKTNLNQTVRQYVKIHATKNGDIYVLVAGTQDIYRRAFGTSTFVALGQTNRAWTAISSDTSGNVYAASGGGHYNCYRQMGGVGDFVLFQPLNTSCYHYFSKINGDMYGLMSNRITIKTNEITDRIFNVSGGNSNFAGKVDIENTPVTTTPSWVLGKNAAPDNEIKKIAIASFDSVSNADSANYLRHLNDATIDISIDSGTIRIVNLAGLPSGGTGDSCLILKNGVPTIVSASSYRTMIGAATPQQISDSLDIIRDTMATKEPAIETGTIADYLRGDKTPQELNAAAVAYLPDTINKHISDSIANKISGSGTQYFIPVWTGTKSQGNSSMLNIGSTVMNIGSASSFQVINTDTNESSANMWFNNTDTKYYNGGVNLTYHKIQNDSGYSHFEMRSYSSAGKYLTFLRIDEQGGLNLNHADYDNTRSIPAMTVDNGGLDVKDSMWIRKFGDSPGADTLVETFAGKLFKKAASSFSFAISQVTNLTDSLAAKISGSGTIGYLSKFTASGTIGNTGIIDSGNVFSTPETTTIHNRNWDSNTGYFQVGTITADSSSYFKMYNKVSGGNTVLRNKNGIGLLTPGSYVVAEDDFHTQYNEEGVAYVNGSKSVRSIVKVDSVKLKSLDSVWTVFTVVDSLFDGGTFRTAGTASVYKMGRNVTVTFNTLTGTITTDTTTYLKFGSNFPAPLAGSIVEPHIITNNSGQVKLGWMYYIGTRYYSVVNYDNSKLAAGTSGVRSATFTYICD